jgi:hypothetical protein
METMTEFKGDKRTKEYKDWKAKQSKGLGDTIAKVTKATGIDKAVNFLFGNDCGCDERKEKLNKLFAYRTECLNETEYKYLVNYFNVRRSIVTSLEQKELIKIYNRVFNVRKQASGCGSCVRSMVKELKNLFNEYNK